LNCTSGIYTVPTAIMTTFKVTANERLLYSKQKDKAKFETPEEEIMYATTNSKTCSKCNLMKLLIEYTGNTSGCDAFDKNGYRLRRPECKSCSKKVSQGKQQAVKIAKKIGKPYKAPDGTVCALCGKLPKKDDVLVFDHCHTTNTFRGYLHNSCNRSMGVLGDDVEGLVKAVNYLNISEKKKLILDTQKHILIMDATRRNSF